MVEQICLKKIKKCLLYAGHDWADVDLAKNSMKLMAEKVMPKINKHSKIAAE